MNVMKKKLWRLQTIWDQTFQYLKMNYKTADLEGVGYNSNNLDAVQEEDNDDVLSQALSDDDKETESEDDDKYEDFAFAQEDVLCSIWDKPGIPKNGYYWIANPQ